MQVIALGLASPTEIQKAVIPEIIAGKNLVMASHTGSGKTLAFLLPLVRQTAKDEKGVSGEP